MSREAEGAKAASVESEQALLRRTIDLNVELIAESDRRISASRCGPCPANEPPHQAS